MLAGFALVAGAVTAIALSVDHRAQLTEQLGHLLQEDSRRRFDGLVDDLRHCLDAIEQWKSSHDGAGPRCRFPPFQDLFVVAPDRSVLQHFAQSAAPGDRPLLREGRFRSADGELPDIRWSSDLTRSGDGGIVVVTAAPALASVNFPPGSALVAVANVPGIRDSMRHAEDPAGTTSFGWVLSDPRGRRIAASTSLSEHTTLLSRLQSRARAKPAMRTYVIDDGEERSWVVGLATTRFEPLMGWKLFSVRRTTTVGKPETRTALVASLSIGLLALVGLGLGWMFDRHLERPLTQLRSVVDEITRTGSLHPRTEVGGPRAIAELGVSLNRMIDFVSERTAQLVRRERDASANYRTSTQLIVSGLAHALNNPLSGMIDCVEELRSGELDEETSKEYLGLLEDGMDRIHHIVTRLTSLDLTTGDRDSIVEVAPVVRAAVGLMHRQIEQAKVNVELSTDAWLVARIDATVLSDIVDNLVSNAIHASEEGSSIEITLTQRNPDEVEMRVEDHGVGMAPRDVARIFEPFYSRRKGGVGLGMWTVRAYLEALDGSIEVESHPGQGTTVSVVLPSAQSAAGEDES